MAKSTQSEFEKIDDVGYRIDEIGQAQERIAGRFHKKIELVRTMNSAKAQLAVLEMEDASDRYLIRELNRSPYSSLKSYYRGEARRQPGMATN